MTYDLPAKANSHLGYSVVPSPASPAGQPSHPSCPRPAVPYLDVPVELHHFLPTAQSPAETGPGYFLHLAEKCSAD